MAGTGAQVSGPPAGSEGIDDAGDLAGVGEMIQKAFAQGNVEVTEENRVIDLRGSGLREQILDAMSRHGVAAEGGEQTIDASAVPGLQEAIMQALADHGVSLDQLGEGQSAPGPGFDSPGDPGSGDSGGGSGSD